MAQVDSENSTAMPAVSTRRRYLSQTAAVTAGGAVLATALSVSASAAGAMQAPDPILAAIEAHKAAHAKFVSWVGRHCKLENELPKERRCSSITAWEEDIVEADDARWIEAERQVGLTCSTEIDAAYTLIEVIPTTRLGMLALLEHAVGHDADGHAWPDEWREGLLENLFEELPKLWQEGRV